MFCPVSMEVLSTILGASAASIAPRSPSAAFSLHPLWFLAATPLFLFLDLWFSNLVLYATSMHVNVFYSEIAVETYAHLPTQWYETIVD